MPKGYEQWNRYEKLLMRTAKTLTKIQTRLDAAAAELAKRPAPVVTPKAKPAKAPKTARQLRLPGTADSRKAAKSPVRRRKSRARRS